MSVHRIRSQATDVIVLSAGQAQTVTKTLMSAITIRAPVFKAAAR